MPSRTVIRSLLRWGSIALVGLGVGTISACETSTQALVVVEQNDNRTQALSTMAQADVLYLGERHTSRADHLAQLDIIQAMHAQNQDVAIALEMIQRPFQAPLDRYIAGEINEEEMIAQTEYMQRWGFPWELYAPIFRYAKQHQLPLLALNTPSEVVRKIARSGLDSLTGQELTYIPPTDQIDTSNVEYQEYVAKAFGGHGGHGQFNFDYFFAAQVTWDETMADVISQFKQTNPNTQVLVLAGQGHVVYGHGIPDRVQRRLGPNLKQQIVLLNLTSSPQSEGIADIIWNSALAPPQFDL